MVEVLGEATLRAETYVWSSFPLKSVEDTCCFPTFKQNKKIQARKNKSMWANDIAVSCVIFKNGLEKPLSFAKA